MKNYRRPDRSIRASRHTSRKPITAANNYGWVVESWEANKAYDLACEYFGEDEINRQIVQAISDDELAECLAFIFRMNDFREWDECNSEDDEDIESSTRVCNSRRITSY